MSGGSNRVIISWLIVIFGEAGGLYPVLMTLEPFSSALVIIFGVCAILGEGNR